MPFLLVKHKFYDLYDTKSRIPRKIKFLEGVASRSALQIVALYVGTTDVLDIPDIA